MASQIGISTQALCYMASGKIRPSFETIEKIESIWGVNLYVLAWAKRGSKNHGTRYVKSVVMEEWIHEHS